MDYELVFDASQAPAKWWFPAFGLIFVGVGIGFLLWIRVHPVGRQGLFKSAGARKAFAWFYTAFGILWTTATSISVFGSHREMQRAMREGRVSVVEGVVREFHPMPFNGHDTERFVVGGVHFAYSDYIVTSGFNRTASHGGPIREGLQVRIQYLGPASQAEIVRLEISRPASP